MATKKFDFSKKLIDISGKEDTTQTLASVLSKMLGMLTEGRTLKLYGWHKELQVSTTLQLDSADEKDLKDVIEKDKNHFIFVKGQLLDVFEKDVK